MLLAALAVKAFNSNNESSSAIIDLVMGPLMGTEATPTFPLDRKWPFRIAVATWLAIGVGSWFLAANIGRPGQVILGGLWLVGLALLFRQFILSLFGPVLAYDVLRVGRQSRRIWFRVGFAVVLAILFAWVYFTWYFLRARGPVRPADLSKLAETYFGVFMTVQFIVVCLLTPASVAGAIAEEKERRTLEFLLATDLRDREILFGKLASRIGGLLLFLLAGLPILALMQFFGGIDPELVLAGFAATLLSVLSLAALSIAASVLSRRTRDAIALTYLLAVAYVLASMIVYAVSMPRAPLSWTVDLLGFTIASDDVAYPFVVGNPFFMVMYVLETRVNGGLDLFTALGHFAIFHAVVIAVCVAWAGWRLRTLALMQMFGSTRRLRLRRKPKATAGATHTKSAPAPIRASRQRPEVGDSPIIWKEVFVDAGLRLGGFGRIIVLGLVGLSLVPVFLIFWFSFVDTGNPIRNASQWWDSDRWNQFGEGMNHYLRAAGTVATTLVFLAIAVRGAGVVSGERDRHTMDALLTTPLSVRTIVWGKWWGCLLGMRWAWAWIFVIWILTLAAGGVHPLMFVAAIISMAVYSSGFAWIGLFCSLHMRTTFGTTMSAIMLSVFLGGGYFLVFVICCVTPLSFVAGGHSSSNELFADFLSAFSPPVNMAWLPVREFDDWELSLSNRQIPYTPFWVLGLVTWGTLSFLLSQRCVTKFRQQANRIAIAPEVPYRPRAPLPRSSRR